MHIQPVNIPIRQNINTQRISQPQYRQLPQHDTVSFGSIFSKLAKKPETSKPQGESLDKYILTDDQSKAREFIEKSGKSPEELIKEAMSVDRNSDRFKEITWTFQVWHKKEGDINIEPLLAQICIERGNRSGIICQPTVMENDNYITRVFVGDKLSFQIVDGVFQEKDIARLKDQKAEQYYEYAKKIEKKALDSGMTKQDFRQELLKEIIKIGKSDIPRDQTRFNEILLILQIFQMKENDKNLAFYIGENYCPAKYHTSIDDGFFLSTKVYRNILGHKQVLVTYHSYLSDD